MLFFIDESFQTIGRASVGALGAVGIPPDRYNHFCGVVHSVKADVFGTLEITERELKGAGTFSRAAFRAQEAGKESYNLTAVDRIIEAFGEVGGIVYATWTTEPELLSLRNTASDRLTGPYISLLQDFCRTMTLRPSSDRGAIFLDQLGHREDAHSASTIANYMARTVERRVLQRHLLQVPHYTHSGVSPGLQMADLVAYLAANQHNPSVRPELQPWWARFEVLAQVEYVDRPGRRPKSTATASAYAGRPKRLRLKW